MQGAYKEVSKQLLPTVLFPSTKEYREALEKYLDEHASHFIDSIGRNSWVSLFEAKLLSDVSKILELLIIIIKKILIICIFIVKGEV